ncbi:MAG: uracil-DNA glycosylase family 4 [Candidatus Marinamargulisbacteria bacterium]|jgi:uracil-DNA glycosylase family 4
MLDFSCKTPYEDLDFRALEAVCKSCTQCPLSETRNQVVFGAGPVSADIMVIGEAPGEQEDLKGEPFIGRSGQLLTKIFESVNIDRKKDVYIANTVKCRPPKNRTPVASEIKTCRPFLIRQIQLIKPKVLILLGAPALKTILEEPLAISKVRGNWYQGKVPYMTAPLHVMPLFHPSYLLRNHRTKKDGPKWQTWKDINEIKSVIDFYQKSPLVSQ